MKALPNLYQANRVHSKAILINMHSLFTKDHELGI